MTTPAPKQWRLLAMVGGGTALMSAVAAGFFQTVGSSVGLMLFPQPTAPAPAATAAVVAAPSPIATPAPARTAEPPAAPSAQTPDADMAAVVRERVPLDFGATSNGPTEGEACTRASNKVMELANRQCGAIMADRRGAQYRLDDVERQCRRCGPSGGEYRCVAHVAPTCVILGGEN